MADREEVIKFLAENGIDDSASNALLSCDEAVQDAVMARGALKAMRNPSSAMLGRIRDAKASVAGPRNMDISLVGIESQVDLFIDENKLDERAADAMRTAAPEEQQAVLQRGSLQDARNPSSAVLGRLRDAKKEVAAAANPDEAEAFIEESGIDERAAEAFRNASPEVQHVIMSKGNLQNANNPSSALLGRLRDAEKQVNAQMGMGMGTRGMRGGPQLANSVEDFIAKGGVDDRAAEALRTAKPMVQQAVLNGGGVAHARNPSSAVLGRIRDAGQNSASMSMMQSMGMGGMGKGGCFGVFDPFGSYGKGGFGGMFGGKGFGGKGMSGPYGGFGGSKSGGGSGRGLSSNRRPSESADINSFIIDNGLDERASDALLACSEEVQKAVMDSGDVKDCRNPSSAVSGRIKDAQREHPTKREGASGAAASPEDVEQFVSDNALDERAATALQSCSPEEQQIVIDRGGLTDARNPSSAVLGRIRDAQKGQGRGNGGNMASQVRNFIEENSLDDRAADALNGAPPMVQEQVLTRGSVRDCRNPSSALLGRIKDATQMISSGQDQMMQMQMMMAKGLAKGMKSGKGGWGGGGKGKGGGGGKGSREAQAFIWENSLDERAAEELLACSPDVQQQVIARGGMESARNPSSAVLGRIKDAKAGKGGGGGGRFSPY